MRGLPRAALLAVLVFSGCGRTGLWRFDDDESASGRSGSGGSAGMPPVDECAVDADCPIPDLCARPTCVNSGQAPARRVCRVEAVDCNDSDECSIDECNPETGLCEHERPTDADGDGYIGTAPRGAPRACGGDDCDDAEPAIHPGAQETCDGRDEDCNGAIDDGAFYEPLGASVRLAPDTARSQHGGIAFDGAHYGVTYSDKSDQSHVISDFALLDGTGTRVAGPTLVSEINADSFAGSVAFSGESFLTAWADARQAGNYEIYATRFNRSAEELQADLRLTDADDFSLRPVIAWTGSEYLVVWEDHRSVESDGLVRVLGQRLSRAGAPLGDAVLLSEAEQSGQYPALALGETRVGIAYAVLDPVSDVSSVMFRTFDFSFEDGTPAQRIGDNGQEPSVAAAGDRFVVVWHTGNEHQNWGNAIAGAALDARGPPVAAGNVTSGDSFAKLRSLLSLGDRFFLVWQGAAIDGSYDLFYELLDPDLTVVAGRQQLTSGAGMSVDPVAALGPDGDIAVLFDEIAPPTWHAYFVRLGCRIARLP